MKIIVFGKGNAWGKLRGVIKSDIEIIGYCDSDLKKQKIENVMPPSMLMKLEFDKIFVPSIKFKFEILHQLLAMGIEREKIILMEPLQNAQYRRIEAEDIVDLSSVKKEIVPFVDGPVDIVHPMQLETTKVRTRREREGFFEKYCSGRGLDIGYGNDILLPTCSGWEYYNGDAQYIMEP